MESFKGNLNFIVALIPHWLKAIVGGGGIGFLVGLYERLKHKQINFKKYIVITIFSAFIIASFSAWQDQIATNEKLRFEKKALEVENSELKIRLSRIEDKRINCNKIGQLLKEGNNLASVCITSKEKPELKVQFANWIKRASNVLSLIKSTYSFRFDQATGVTLFHNGVPPINNEIWSEIYYKTQMLARFLEELHC